jgi:hypothetical protein
VQNPSSDASPGEAVVASLAVGPLQGGTDVVAPSVGQEEYALNASNGAKLAGFPWFTSDSDFSTPALADLYGDGNTEIIEGGDQTAGWANGVDYTQGGHLRVIAPTGNAGSASPSAGLDCEYNTTQGIESSPAVGEFLAGGAVGIAVGTSKWPSGGSGDADKVLALGTNCNLVWSTTLDGATTSSPALADLMGSGGLEVVEGTDNGTSGSVYALSGTSGAVLWQQPVPGRVIGGVVTADLGGGYQDVIAATTKGAVVLDGRTGAVVTSLAPSTGLQNSPLVTDDPNGSIGLTIAGYNGHDQGVVVHYQLTGSNGAGVNATGSWPMFHHDPQLSGNAGVPSGGAAILTHPSSTCSPPADGTHGYYEVSSSGRVFNYGNVPSCGSPKQPAVGMAAMPDGDGYWVVTSSGRVSAFGNATPYGSAALKAPLSIVGIAATPDALGYWLVANNGEVFGFGDAKFYGPRADLGVTIVGIAATPDGGGYWLAARDGRVFHYGDAAARGATFDIGDIVAIAADRSTGGYWLAGSNGAVYGFGAPYYGGASTLHLGYPMTGLEAAGGSGYRLVDSGGEVLCFGAATDQGSAGKLSGGASVVGIAGP